jgi:S-adenosylmethionine hydrolase
MPRPIITLTTDFGSSSPYVAQMKGVILGINPDAHIVDITHAIPPQDIAAGALALREVLPAFPEGTIHVAVVDPGVGTARRIISGATRGQRLIGPDNGLLSWCGELAEVHEVSNKKIFRPEVSNTFHGRDIMAPVAARLSLGTDAATLGPPATSWVHLPWPAVDVSPQRIRGEVISVDAFGNLITNIRREDWDRAECEAPIIRLSEAHIHGLSCTYGESPAGHLVAVFGSGELLEIAEVNGHAARRLAVGRGAPVEIS